MSRTTRARDRQRHRERAKQQLTDVPDAYLIDELVRRSGIEAGEIRLAIRNGHFLHMNVTAELHVEGGTGVSPDSARLRRFVTRK